MSAERAPGPVRAPDLPAGQGGRARRGGHPGRARTWCGAGGFLPSEVMDLAHSTVASAPMWLRPKRRKKKKRKRTMCFLLRDSQAGPRVLLWGQYYNIKMQPDSGQARPCRWLERVTAVSHGRRRVGRRPGRCVPRGVAHGGRRPGVRAVTRAPRGGRTPATRASRRRRLGDASPAPASSRAVRGCFPSPYLSLKLIFFFNLVTGTKVTGKSFVKAKRSHKYKSGHFTVFVTKYLPCW